MFTLHTRASTAQAKDAMLTTEDQLTHALTLSVGGLWIVARYPTG